MSAEGERAENRSMIEELDRLRALVGPNESSYSDLRSEIAAARDEGRWSDAELGNLRAEITGLRVELHRAQQDQYHIRRLFLSPALAMRNRLQRRRATSADQTFADQG